MAAGKFGVNYCLIYGTSETASDCRRLGDLVNCYLDYGTSETDPVLYINEKR